MDKVLFNFQPTLRNELIIAEPLCAKDFNDLYAAASDPLVWEQHPNQNRYQLDEFTNYFTGAMESGGALLVKDAATEETLGCSRYSDHDAASGVVSVGYTFFKRSHWGKGHNYALKTAMLEHVFPTMIAAHFYIGACNKRSQVSLERFGATKIGEQNMAYYGEVSQLNFVYSIASSQWEELREKHVASYQLK